MCVSLSEGASLADRESSLDLIKLDISRTFPSLFIFQKVTELRLPLLPPPPPQPSVHHSVSSLQGGPYHDLLHSVLGAYTCYRPDIGYVSPRPLRVLTLAANGPEPELTAPHFLTEPVLA